MSSCLVLALLFQGPLARPPADALTFLSKVTQQYSDAKSYHIEATVETTNSNELSRNWQKELLTAIVAPGGRYRYEGRSGIGSALLVSDGTKEWDYHIDEHQYSEARVSAEKPGGTHVIPQEEISIMEANYLVERIRTLSTQLKSASFLPDETVELDGRSIECRVVHFADADFSAHMPGIETEETVWVDKARNLIVKTASRGVGYTMLAGSKTHIPINTEETTVYPVVRLDSPEPESSFTFSPPSDAKPVASFANRYFPRPPHRADDFLGKPAPEIHLSREGKDVLLSSYRGKPVFLEFWATFCEPCVALVPGLKELYAETHDRGLVWIGINKDEDAGTMEAYVRQEGIPWPNYHDQDGSLSKAFDCWGIPLGVLIDSSGKITFYRAGDSLAELRAAIAKLGPEFSSVTAKAATTETAPPRP